MNTFSTISLDTLTSSFESDVSVFSKPVETSPFGDVVAERLSSKDLYKYRFSLRNANIVYGFDFLLQVVFEHDFYSYVVVYKDSVGFLSPTFKFKGDCMLSAKESFIRGIDLCLSGQVFKLSKRCNGKSLILKNLRYLKTNLIEFQTSIF